MQEAAYRMFKNIKSVKNTEYFKTWLIRITMNCAVDHIRKNSKFLQTDTEYLENIEEILESHEKEILLQTTLKELMEILEAEEKNVILLKYYYEYSFLEISEILKNLHERCALGVKKAKIEERKMKRTASVKKIAAAAAVMAIGVLAVGNTAIAGTVKGILEKEKIPFNSIELVTVKEFIVVDENEEIVASGEDETITGIVNDGKVSLEFPLEKEGFETGKTYYLKMTEFEGSKKADAPLMVKGGWECRFYID